MNKQEQLAYLKGFKEGIEKAIAFGVEAPPPAKATSPVKLKVTKRTSKSSPVRNKDAKSTIISILEDKGALDLYTLKVTTGFQHQVFYRALGILLRTGRVKRTGKGVKNDAYKYFYHGEG